MGSKKVSQIFHYIASIIKIHLLKFHNLKDSEINNLSNNKNSHQCLVVEKMTKARIITHSNFLLAAQEKKKVEFLQQPIIKICQIKECLTGKMTTKLLLVECSLLIVNQWLLIRNNS